jgi:hypothetical protein
MSSGSGAGAEPAAEVGLELGHHRAGVLLLQPGEHRVAGVALGVPLVGEPAADDVVAPTF